MPTGKSRYAGFIEAATGGHAARYDNQQITVTAENHEHGLMVIARDSIHGIPAFEVWITKGTSFQPIMGQGGTYVGNLVNGEWESSEMHKVKKDANRWKDLIKVMQQELEAYKMLALDHGLDFDDPGDSQV